MSTTQAPIEELRALKALPAYDPFPMVTDLLALWARERPLATAFSHLTFDGSGPVKTSYVELRRSAVKIAAHLTRCGLRGRPVLLLYPSGPDFAPAFFGVLLAGAIATPVPLPHFKSQYQRLDGVAADCTPGA